MRSVKSYQTSSNSNLISMPQPLTARRSAAISGRVKVPGDKSISHRALILAGLATGRTRIEGLLEADDVLATARAVEALGASVVRDGDVFEVLGQGVGGLSAPDGVLDFGNSGTASRLMLGVLAGYPMPVSLTGDASLCRRPMSRVLKPLMEMGLLVEDDRETLPLTVVGTQDLLPIVYELPVPSAQVKSAILLAGLHAPGRTTVIEPLPTRDHTERMLRYFGAEVDVETRADGSRAVTVTGDAELRGAHVIVPGDPSSAAFLVAAALICPGSDLTIENVLLNPTRTGFFDTLQEMGADIAVLDQRDAAGEPVGDLRIRSSALRGVRVPPERAPSMIDEYPVLAALAAFAEGETRMEGSAELKVKESDRLAATAAGLAACGVTARIEGDDLIVTGTGAVRGGGTVATEMDHRIAMAFLTLGLGAEEPVAVDDIAMIATSFPAFVPLMTGLGARLG
ncbi:3-phosphoshikimate 1-carboxyvinyltransferase [Methyloceanibacter stevinii]|uniref:3-phosphoshikimate 1-carboxyvinyltransferase n=1 Tax=Methyloceanibacter stevinii TaxID=1774970 RepID=A0A1E3VQ27_9HYPH|nr:3-phosphoshikimate 1-carboxyvinyltransferase [Methyloceanibacter stevinii]ODR95638.1 3-phosphoshikimate 1-carboxyvinyltransferase [Methyloceanibacter stevinii]